MSSKPDGKLVAQKVAEYFIATDKSGAAMELHLDDIGPGYATMSMSVRDDMVNGHNICHGGKIFTLADSAFAYACNSYNRVAVAQTCDITFTNSAKLGDRLTAVCDERYHRGRSGVYDVTVTDQTGLTIAVFRGISRTLSGHLVEGLTDD
ncbi:MAG: hydroxyphenylacetyl-CoA thioesterase PaaI [Rhodospirillaceae bacterium]|nr:hydroxyphenylacetyl-CoA thioesterase PaaI [Rhodospirillaceae bacterium]MBT6137190.1 hydroxyphenylacetyl-CoA thioesterase PaaI [Rhodospirillaceae bacterium]